MRRRLDCRRVSIWLGIGMLLSACGNPGLTEADVESSVGRVVATGCRSPSEGSAVAVADGVVITNAHVVAGSDRVEFVTLDGSRYPATITGFDKDRDLAALAVPGLEAPTLELAEGAEDDDAVIAGVTTDLTLDLIETSIRRPIIATGDDIYGGGDVSRAALELAADIQSGVSGAGVFLGGGELIGIVFAESRNFESSYAVSASEVEAFLDQNSDQPVESGPCL